MPLLHVGSWVCLCRARLPLVLTQDGLALTQEGRRAVPLTRPDDTCHSEERLSAVAASAKADATKNLNPCIWHTLVLTLGFHFDDLIDYVFNE